MLITDFIQLATRPPPLPFLVIGGWAVAAHGHARMTFDVDFLAPDDQRPDWLARTAEAGLSVQHQAKSFVQFVDPVSNAALDVMFVNRPTFDGLWNQSLEVPFGSTTARIPSLDHLIALKLHVLKQALPHRTNKDAEDVEMLARRHQLNLSSPHYETLFLKYGTRELLDTFRRILRHP